RLRSAHAAPWDLWDWLEGNITYLRVLSGRCITIFVLARYPKRNRFTRRILSGICILCGTPKRARVRPPNLLVLPQFERCRAIELSMLIGDDGLSGVAGFLRSNVPRFRVFGDAGKVLDEREKFATLAACVEVLVHSLPIGHGRVPFDVSPEHCFVRMHTRFIPA